MSGQFQWSSNYKDVDPTQFDLLRRITKRLKQRKKLFAAIEKHCPPGHASPSLKILEVACGMGIEANLLAVLGYDVYGIDREQEALHYGQRVKNFFRSGIHLAIDDAFAMQFPNAMFDALYSQGFLEHFNDNDVIRLIAEQLRVLKKDGLLFIDVPNRLSGYTIYKKIFETIHGEWLFGFERAFSPGQIRKFVEKTDIPTICLERYGWSFLGYPVKSLFDYGYMAIALAIRTIMRMVNRGQDNVCIIFKKV